MGVSLAEFDDGIHNPMNREVFEDLTHNDAFGMEAKIFSICFQEVREKTGPFKIFGSR